MEIVEFDCKSFLNFYFGTAVILNWGYFGNAEADKLPITVNYPYNRQ